MEALGFRESYECQATETHMVGQQAVQSSVGWGGTLQDIKLI